jgi:hypothetical protein
MLNSQKLDVQCYKIDCTYNKTSDICDGFKVKEYPTITYSFGGNLYIFNGTRNEYNILEFIKKEYVNADNIASLPGHEKIWEKVLYYYNIFMVTLWYIKETNPHYLTYSIIGGVSLGVVMSFIVIKFCLKEEKKLKKQ